MDDTADAGVVVVFGGRSEIGLELATRLAAGRVVVLAARGAERLGEECASVAAAGATAVHAAEFDADDLASHGPMVQAIIAEHGPIGTAVVAFGILGDQARAEVDPAHAAAIVHTDFTAQVSLLTVLAATMRSAAGRAERREKAVGRAERREKAVGRAARREKAVGRAERREKAEHGVIVVFSSVAGARVRRANYVYGSAKAGLDGFARGLADALHGTGVRLLLVRPGFVVGRMTHGMSPAPLSSTPSEVADAAARALAKGRNEIWVPRALGPLVLALRLLPRSVWRRMPR